MRTHGGDCHLQTRKKGLILLAPGSQTSSLQNTYSPPFSAAWEPDVHGPYQQAPLASGFL